MKGIEFPEFPEWTGHHVGECGSSARGGPRRPEYGCLPSCSCPCHREDDTRSGYVTQQRKRFRDAYTAELKRARNKGYDEVHDHEHGAQHLLDWATEYIFRDEPVKAAAMIAAARSLLACAIPEHSHGALSHDARQGSDDD